MNKVEPSAIHLLFVKGFIISDTYCKQEIDAISEMRDGNSIFLSKLKHVTYHRK